MQRPKIITMKQDDGDLLVNAPRYSQTLVEGIKNEDVFPRSDRTWKPPNWRVKAVHIEALRTLVATIADTEGWQFVDETAQSEEVIQAKKDAIEEGFLDHHVAAVIAVLPKLPAKALRLVAWTEEYLELELKAFLDNPELFKELIAASLQSYRPTILYGGNHKREFQRTFIVQADERILHALCTIAGTVPITKRDTWGTNVEYFVVRPLRRTQIFEDGIAHFTGEDDSVWVGFPYQKNPIDRTWSRSAWQVTVDEGTIYIVYHAIDMAKELLAIKESQYVNPGVGNVAVAQSHPSVIAQFIQLVHAEEWFKEWGNEIVQEDQLIPSLFQKPRWYDWAWSHPADDLLNQGSPRLRQGVSQMYHILGWNEPSVEMYRQRIQQLKGAAGQAVIDDMRTRSAELASPLLQNSTISQLMDLAGKHQVEVKKSLGKERILQVLVGQARVCEDIIGLTKRLESKR